jgi:hypothetical protein
MLTTVVPRIAVRQVFLAADGLLSSGAITPVVGSEAAGRIPERVVAADVYNVATWTFSDNASVGFPVAAGSVRHLPGSFVKDAIFAAGTYTICFYLDI